MLRSLSLSSRPRRRPRYGVYLCAVVSSLLLLLSVSLLYSRLSHSHSLLNHRQYRYHSTRYDTVSLTNPLISDEDLDDNISSSTSISATEDKIDELDDIEDTSKNDELDEDDERQQPEYDEDNRRQPGVSSIFFYDHVTGAIRKAFKRGSIEEWDDNDYVGFNVGLGALDRTKAAFGSDDVPVDEEVRIKISEVVDIEDALLLKTGRKVSPLRQGWGDWFDKKGDFLRRDRMFKSNLEILNPLNNPMLQDPDGIGVTTLTKGDRLVQKALLNEFKRVPFLVKKPPSISETTRESKFDKNGDLNGFQRGTELESAIERAKRRTLDESASGNVDSKTRSESEVTVHMYADGKRWGYYPGLDPFLSFSDFMEEFFKQGKCDLKVYMVWNSPPWMYSVRYQRGLESLFKHHPNACVVIFSETIDLDFFKESFVKDGYKVAVVMPNLDELLKDTPTHVFTSAWYEWRKTKYYATHYSELVRLAVLYKYGGLYLDSDIIVLRPLVLRDNSVGLEDKLTGTSLNGAVMTFRRHSPFIMECLKEFYMTYDDTKLRWNGADLLSRVAKRFLSTKSISVRKVELKLRPSFEFFPIGSQDIIRYFTAPKSETEKIHQDAMVKKILDKSMTFHFWNRLSCSLIPEQGSLAARLIDHPCIRCFDVL